MDLFLSKVTQQAMNYAIRSGVTLTASYAIRQSTKLLNSAPKSDTRDELLAQQRRLGSKIRIVSPAIDMIELMAARGNTSLESAVALTKELRLEIQSLGQRIARAARASEDAAAQRRTADKLVVAQNEAEMKLIILDIKALLDRIEDAVPLINLAITTSGASLSTSLPHTVSPSRLLQASTFLTDGDTRYASAPQRAVQVGPTFHLTVYMLFAGHDRPQNEDEIRETTWKEVIHKARAKLRRVPLDVVLGTGSGRDAIPSVDISSPGPVTRQNDDDVLPADARADEYAYQMMIIEDLEDDRFHDLEEEGQPRPGPFDDVRLAGIREMIPIHEISKIFYADTSKVLNIGADAESNHPVLLLKRDLNAVPPRRMMKSDSPDDVNHAAQEQPPFTTDHPDPTRDPWRFPPSLDPEWIAFEVYTESESTDSESETEEEVDRSGLDGEGEETSHLADTMSHVHLDRPSTRTRTETPPSSSSSSSPPPWVNAIKTSLSLLELLLRLTSLQQFQQQSHLCITDELLNFFLEESATTGAGGDEGYRQAVRADARRRVGWDPYDESPVKRRGEDYQYYSPSPRGSPQPGPQNGAWSPRDAVQTRSITAVSHLQQGSSPSPSSSPLTTNTGHKESNRAAWLRRADPDKGGGSPLRPRTAITDEGIGTSPASEIGGRGT
jgi:hypothetical protein